MGLGYPLGDSWDEPDEDDYRAVNDVLLIKLLVSQVDNLHPQKRSLEFADILKTTQWYLAFDIEGWESRRRQFAQKKVAERSGKELPAVQGKVRDVYDAKAGCESAQKLFEHDLEAIEQAYESHLEVR